jgi:hypothetical protein
MRVHYPITEAQLIAAFSKAYVCDDGCIYVQLPTLTFQAPLPPMKFPASLSLEERGASPLRIYCRASGRAPRETFIIWTLRRGHRLTLFIKGERPW